MQLIKEVKDFNLKHIFDCGQCFRWEEEADGSYTGTAFGKTVNMRLEREADGACCAGSGGNHGGGFESCSGFLIIDGASEEDFENIWRVYLDLDRDYGEIKKTLAAGDLVVANAIKSGEGIRLLNQDNWETLISFIISQNNNIPRIKRCIENLSAAFGEPLPEYRGRKRYAFPTFERLSELEPEDLSEIRLGYRARYITETAKAVASDGGEMLYSLSEVPTKEAYEYLTSLCGVGPKVANCILLFSMEKYESFPIDVWVRRVMNRLYNIDENDVKSMSAFAGEKFGAYGGFAQQYLFYYMREFKEEAAAAEKATVNEKK